MALALPYPPPPHTHTMRPPTLPVLLLPYHDQRSAHTLFTLPAATDGGQNAPELHPLRMSCRLHSWHALCCGMRHMCFGGRHSLRLWKRVALSHQRANPLRFAHPCTSRIAASNALPCQLSLQGPGSAS